ncbi:hypothetical protein FB561_7185 [Kribbella amoyensis]|uniref:Uncharacterized protein n=1 Tax=Kribbella amoyensis TaxID=996641 RepID=A0A561B376_9ACTN|nr:hypothetical protein FB561_7185 [Kribbella amoyensis]
MTDSILGSFLRTIPAAGGNPAAVPIVNCS